MTNNRRKFHTGIECVPSGFANGVASNYPLTKEEKELMIEEATEHFGVSRTRYLNLFLSSLVSFIFPSICFLIRSNNSLPSFD